MPVRPATQSRTVELAKPAIKEATMGFKEIKDELSREFPALLKADQYLNWSASAGALLEEGSESSQVKKALATLDQRMFEQIRSRIKLTAFPPEDASAAFKGKTTDERHKMVVDNLVGEYGAAKPKTSPERRKNLENLKAFIDGKDPFSKVLVTVLAEDEKDCAYPEQKDAKFHPRYFVGFLKRETFLDTIRSGRHWKDVGASPLHGEYTHRLQWYLIANSGDIPRNQVGALYRFVGGFRDESKDPDSIGQKDLWPRLCDRPRMDMGGGNPGDTTKPSDFRAPEHITRFFLNSGNDYPILKAFIVARFEKRSQGMGDETNFPSTNSMQHYVAKKIFGKAYAELKEQERSRIDLLTSGQQTDKPNFFDRA